MRGKYRKWIRFAIGLAISGIFLYLAFRGTDWKTVLKYLSKITISSLLLSLFALFIHMIIRSLRWEFIADRVEKITFDTAFTSIILGYFFNFILPFRLGELVKASITSRRAKNIPVSTSIGFMVVERGMDLLTLLLMFVIILPYVKVSGSIKTAMITSLYVVIAAFIFFILLYKLYPRKQLKNRSNKMVKLITDFVESLRAIGGIKTFLILLIYSFLLWPFTALYYFAILKGTNINLPFIVAFLLPLVVGLGIAIPSAPGFIGTYEYIIIIVLKLYGINHDLALTAALVIHFWQYIIIIIIGSILLMRESSLNINKIKDINSE